MILQGDARALPLADRSVDCVVTSPPYWGLRDYGVPGQLGLESSPDAYVDQLVTVGAEIWRVLRDDGTLWLNLGDCYATGAGRVGESPGGGEQGARWRGEIDRLRDDKRGYRGENLPNGRGDQPAILRVKTAGRGAHTADNSGKAAPRLAALGPMTQPNRMPIAGLKPKDLIGIPWRVAFALQAAGWWLRADIIWAKPNPMPESVTDRPTKAHEYLFLLAKSERYYYDAAAIAERSLWPDGPNAPDAIASPYGQGFTRKAIARQNGDGIYRPNRADTGGVGAPCQYRNRRSVWTIATQPYPEAHFATFPEDLVKPCILAGSRDGGIVLDPFAGSGTVIKVAQDCGRRGIGLELNPAYTRLAYDRARQLGFATTHNRQNANIAEPTAQNALGSDRGTP